MKFHYPPPWYPKEDNTSSFEQFLKFQEWNDKQERRRKREEKKTEEEKKKKGRWVEDPKPITLSTWQTCILLVALGPIIGPLQVILIFNLFHWMAQTLISITK